MLFCITANYTPKALEAMGKNPKTNRREAVEKLVTAGGGKLESAPDLTGSWSEVVGAVGSFTVQPAGNRKFYRVSL